MIIYGTGFVKITARGEAMKATNSDIIVYVKNKYGYKPKPCWISHVKEICGLDVKMAHNRKSKDVREVPCPPNKINDIKNALKNFGLI